MKFNPNRYDLILLFAVVSGIYYVGNGRPRAAPRRGAAPSDCNMRGGNWK